MKQALLLLVVLIAAAHCASSVVTKEMVDYIRSQNPHWTASLDAPHARLTHQQVRTYLGVIADDGSCVQAAKEFTPSELRAAPASFDAREQWPHCKSVAMVRDQSDCGSCWAFGAAEAISDRVCIHSNGTVNVPLSAEDMNSCSGMCGSCNGGMPSCAWRYWVSSGLVSEECYPYSLPSCDHHIANSSNPCDGKIVPTPSCKKQCTGNKNIDFAKDKHFGEKSYSVSGEEKMMAELSSNGPCEATITVYEDFEAYTGGIYHHVTGKSLGGHAIRILGYGEENGVKYWLLANSWNEHWGEKGYFRMRRGNNECGVENSIVCGIPKN